MCFYFSGGGAASDVKATEDTDCDAYINFIDNESIVQGDDDAIDSTKQFKDDPATLAKSASVVELADSSDIKDQKPDSIAGQFKDQKPDSMADQFVEILPIKPICAPLHCHFCFMDFKKESDLKKHRKVVHPQGQQKYKCHKCNNNKLYPSYEKLKDHMRVHRPRYKCVKCEYKSHDIRFTKEHILRIHIQIAPFKCQPCGKNYYSARYLQEHVRKCH